MKQRGFARCLSLVAVAAQVTLVTPTSAQPRDRAGAEALFQRGRDAMARDDFDAACGAFEESNRLDPAPGTMANLAGCEEARGHLAAAWQWFEEVSAKLPATDPRRELAKQKAVALRARLAVLTVRLADGAPRDSKVVRDAIELHGPGLGTPLPVDPGPHRIIVSAPGHEARPYEIELREREQEELLVEPGALAAGAGAASGPSPASSNATSQEGHGASPRGITRRTAGYVVVGVGAAGIGTALVLGGVVLARKSTVSDHCDTKDHTCDAQAGIDAASSGRTLSAVSTVSFLIGAAATGVGTYFILTSKDEPKTTVGAAGAPGGGFLQVTRAF